MSGNAVRIYMSATPEVAFEPIIKAEYEYLEKRNLKLLENSKPVLLVNNIPMVSDAELKSQYTSCLFIYFYYLKRNYDYISNVYVYENDENLVKVINEKASKKNKWLCFAHSKDAGAEMKKAITHSCAFITSDNKNNGEEKAFEKITNNKCFDEEVLIATSVLDNGISIEDENVCNIAIDQFDRVEFIQMLSRLRISNDSQENRINLYVKKYTMDDLKEIVKKAAQNLIYRLLADTVSYEKLCQITDENKLLNNTLDKNIIFIQPSNNKGQYNPCAIYAIVDFMGYVMKIIRKNDANYCISFSNPRYEAIRSNVIDYYKNGDGRNKTWSRSVIDVLESSLDFKQRNKYREEDLCQGMVEDRYTYMLEDNFLHYLFFEKIPEYASNNEEHNLNKWLDGLSPENKNYVNCLFKRGIQQSNSRSLSVLEKMNIVKEDFIYNRFSEEQKREFNYYLDEIALNDAVTKYYRSLSEKEFTHPIDMQLNWIEKTEYELLGENENTKNVSNENSCNEDDYFDFIVKNAVSEEDLIKNQTASGYDSNFLEKHGFIKDGDKAQEISEKYLHGKSLMQAAKIKNGEYQTIKIPVKTEDGEKIQTYRLMSCQANRKQDRTFYVYVLLHQESKNELLSDTSEKNDNELSSVDSKE